MVDQAKLSEFLGVTGCDDPAKAQFFLESANGDLGAAVGAFYEHGDAPTDAPDPSPPSLLVLSSRMRLPLARLRPTLVDLCRFHGTKAYSWKVSGLFSMTTNSRLRSFSYRCL